MAKIIAHRGDTSRFPENTVEAFAAARQKGADGVELDVHMTADGWLVVHHDYYLGNPDNGQGLIPMADYDYIKELAIGTNYHIPTLDEIFAKFGKTLHYEIELKAYTIEALHEAAAAVQRHGLAGNVEFTSPHPYMLQLLKQLYPAFTTGYFSMPQPGWMDAELYREVTIANAKLGKIDVVHYSPAVINELLIAAVHGAGMKIHAADCDSRDELDRMLALRVDQISTNQLDTAIAARTQASRR